MHGRGQILFRWRVRFEVLAAVVLAAVVLVSATLSSAANVARPNILLILADDVGIEPLGCYGGTSFETPHIDRLAVTGMRFQHCYSMPVCHPTRVCLLTGRYPRHIGNPSWGSFPSDLERATIAAYLKQVGYATAVAGKWQLALLGKDLHQPHRMGFDEYCLFGWHEGSRYHNPLIWQNGNRRGDTDGQYGPDLYVDFLIDFMNRHREQPFFAFYSMALCHDVTDDLDQPVAYPPGKNRYMSYAEMVRSMDTCVGRIVDAVEDLELSNRTLILFTGDNGTAKRSIIRAVRNAKGGWSYEREAVACEHRGRLVPGGKGSLQDSGTRVPLLAKWAGTIAPNQVVDDLVDVSDFFPTFAQLAGQPMESRSALDGISFAQRLRAGEPSARAWAYAESRNQFWVRTQRYKLLDDGQFFDLQQDPDEAHPLMANDLPPSSKEARVQLLQAVDQLKTRSTP